MNIAELQVLAAPTTSAGATKRRGERRRALPLLPEVRHFAATNLEVRHRADTDELVVEGLAIRWGAAYQVIDPLGSFEETIHRGAVTELLANGTDCRFLFNHDGLPMARTTSNTLKLTDGTQGLAITASLDARQQLANDLHIAISRGDVSAMSVGMIVGQDKWGERAGIETRDIYKLKSLLDVSAVTYPCSPTTSVEVAQRLALRMPVESRARLRRLVAGVSSGKPLSRDQVQGLRSLLDTDYDASVWAATAQVTAPATTGRMTASRLRQLSDAGRPKQ